MSDMGPETLAELLELAETIKCEPSLFGDALRGKAIALVFDEPSSRMRCLFAAAAGRLGATPIPLGAHELQLGSIEPVADTARWLSAFADAVVVRTPAQETVEELARSAGVPVVNAHSTMHHPCQALADLLTIRETFADVTGRRVAFVGDGGDSVAHSLLEGCALVGLDLTIACPPEHPPDAEVLHRARSYVEGTGVELQVVHDPAFAVADASVVYAEPGTRTRALAPFEVTEDLLALAKPDAIFLHRPPAVRDVESASAVIDGPQSAVWRQCANQLPTEEALLLLLTRGQLG
jgi:ornithine carbamoyltransferase